MKIIRFTLTCGLLLVPLAQAHDHSKMTMPMPAATPSPNTNKAPLPLSAKNGVIVAVPPSIKETSVFMTLTNTSSMPIKLVGLKSSVAGMTMLMHTVKNGQMLGMTHATSLTVPAKGQLVLNNDGDHLMLQQLKRPLKVGEVLPITLIAADGRTLTVQAKVQKP